MSSIIRVTNVEINNLKNVKRGYFHTNSNFEQLKEADVIGFYGQNGSGKTAVVDAFSLLHKLIGTITLPEVSSHLIYFNEKSVDLTINFIVKNKFGEYFLKYKVSLTAGKHRLGIMSESISYRENIKNKRFKEIICIHKKSKEAGSIITYRNKSIDVLSEKQRINIGIATSMALENNTSFVFRGELKEVFTNEIEAEIMRNMTEDFFLDLHVIDNYQYGLVVSNLIMPFSIHHENDRGNIPLEMSEMNLPIQLFEVIVRVIEQINIVLKNIIPGLEIKVRTIGEPILTKNNEEEIRFEFMSKKGDVVLPLKSESSGVLKIISILSTLIAVYNKPNACVVIDELDAGIFEYLLGEILEVMSDNGQGQLFFTSHNLRILEVLPIRNLWFTTLNEEDRYLQLKGVRKLSNARDIYLRAVQLGGQDEQIYDETNMYDMKTSFRKAGIQNGEK
ncbi:AAA family ATPase [Chengkuizengella axinellae]|uniref:AAA family ATPase n=1 Tax=Chengkuizengella axinellae TaxID=3064388 RepID=A0ABT9J3J3_9BACL|nr:AAA family ATPase [Chengkuizengella sp. 2205SS18-9]MDP5276192.1 AAA family ATPase [Chengkuizengella sp. 2205SS18-9]